MRHWKEWLAAVGVLVVAAVLGGVLLCRRPQEIPEAPAVSPALPLQTAAPAAAPKPAAIRPEPALAQPAASKATHIEYNAKILDGLRALEPSQPVRVLVGLARESDDRNARIQALRSLTRNLPPKDVEALRLFLKTRYEDRPDYSARSFNGVKSDILDVLCRQDKLPEHMGGQLAGMSVDDGFDAMWRDYCLQYMTVCMERQKQDGAFEPGEQGEIVEAYWKAAETNGTALAGTALLGLERLSRKDTSLDRERIGRKAVEIVKDEGAIEASRITALRICGSMGKTDIMPAARVIAQTGETTALRAAAIATIGELGEPGDRELLTALATSDDPRIKRTAEGALKKIGESAN